MSLHNVGGGVDLFCVFLESIATMSALQTFLLVVDHDREEAKQIAERVAQGEWLFRVYHSKDL